MSLTQSWVLEIFFVALALTVRPTKPHYQLSASQSWTPGSWPVTVLHLPHRPLRQGSLCVCVCVRSDTKARGLLTDWSHTRLRQLVNQTAVEVWSSATCGLLLLLYNRNVTQEWPWYRWIDRFTIIYVISLPQKSFFWAILLLPDLLLHLLSVFHFPFFSSTLTFHLNILILIFNCCVIFFVCVFLSHSHSSAAVTCWTRPEDHKGWVGELPTGWRSS